jgi:hypothetical protein
VLHKTYENVRCVFVSVSAFVGVQIAFRPTKSGTVEVI